MKPQPVNSAQVINHRQDRKRQLPFECIALVLQGGGALGSYQAGVFEALAEADLQPDWTAGISIGAINAAIIAGNAPEDRVTQLRGFWESITVNPLLDWATACEHWLPKGKLERSLYNQMSAGVALMIGAGNFFAPRYPSPFFQADGTIEATSFYSVDQLKTTLEQFIDFDRINHNKSMRFSVGAVNVKSGNFCYFDNTTQRIRVEHVMASGSLPPGFPATEIDGEFFWDGGLISNTPLQWVVDGEVRQDTLAFQIDLWSAIGRLPRNVPEVMTRQKEIQYSSRTRAGTNEFKRIQSIRKALANLLPKLPAELQDDTDVALLKREADYKIYNVVHLIYRSKPYEGLSKDYEFSRLTMQEHWRSGYRDAIRTLRHPEIFERPPKHEGVFTFDFLRKDRHPD